MAKAILRQLIETDNGPVRIAPVRFCHEGGGPHWACASCLATVMQNGDLVHAKQCGAAMGQEIINEEGGKA